VTDSLCTLLEWDSRFFGCRIARANPSRLTHETCESLLAWCEAHDVDCLYFLATPDDPETTCLAETHAFRLVDVRVDFERHLAAGQAPVTAADIRPAAAGDVPELRAIAGTSHHATRFYFDARFSRDRCDELYRTWITRSCEGFADAVLVADRGGRAAGYITVHLEEGARARVGLVGVAEAWRGHGVGGALVDAALHWSAGRGRTSVSVATQARNIGGIRLYERAGFQAARVGLWYHRWFGRA
jgi:GNAT superfamily N-acetyltransferase